MESNETFNTIGDAFVWYVTEGGQREKTSFYAKVPRSGGSKRISRFAVSEMLRKERKVSTSGADLSDRREKAETDKAEADARISRAKADAVERELDAAWVRREEAEEETCVWVSRLRDAVTYHLGKNLLAIIHASGGQAGRLAEVQTMIDAVLASACNEIAESSEITVEIE